MSQGSPELAPSDTAKLLSDTLGKAFIGQTGRQGQREGSGSDSNPVS